MTDTPPDNDGYDEHVDVEVRHIDIDGTVGATVTTTTDAIDIDDDGRTDMVTITEEVMVDVDGDGEADYVETTTTVFSDVDGDGITDVIDRHTVTEAVIDGQLEVIGESSEETTVLGGTAALAEEDESDGN